MRRIAIVVQRSHESVVGGSEALAWQYARLLATAFEVEILTTTATDYVSWDNVLPPGTSQREGVVVRRFPVGITRSAYWTEWHRRMLDELPPGRADAPHGHWREAMQEEFIRFQGPYCPELETWLQQHRGTYAAVLFCTYLYPTAYFGIRHIAPARSILVPTLHDEPPAYLPVFAQRYAAHTNRIWLTAAEQRTCRRLWGYDEGEVLGMAVEHIESAQPEVRPRPYLLYCGRIEANKGCDDLLQAFQRLPSRGRVSLVLTGVDHMGLPESPDIEYLGFVDESRKFALMAGACAFVLPSFYESFSIVTLEAMAQRTPVLVNGRCEVMRDHIEQSGGGLHYSDRDEMTEKLEQLCTQGAAARTRMGAAGHDYVRSRYREDHIRARLNDYVAQVIARADAAAV